MPRGVGVSALLERDRAAACPTVPHESFPQTGSCSNYCHASQSRCRQCSGRSSVARLERRLREIPRTHSMLGYKPPPQHPVHPDLFRLSSVRDCTHRLGEAEISLQKWLFFSHARMRGFRIVAASISGSFSFDQMVVTDILSCKIYSLVPFGQKKFLGMYCDTGLARR